MQQFSEHGLILMDGEGADIISLIQTWAYNGSLRWRGQLRECKRRPVGVQPMLQVYGRWHALGSTYGAFRFSSPLAQATNGRHVDVLVQRGHRGTVSASTHLVGRCVSEGWTPFGRWMVLRSRYARTGRLGVVQVSFLFLLQESSYISHYLESCLSISRRFF